MSMLDPLKKIMEKYRSLLTIMQANQNSIQMAKVSETPHVQIVLYDAQCFETCQLIRLKSIRFQKIENQIRV
jgi:hypothetical protein